MHFPNSDLSIADNILAVLNKIVSSGNSLPRGIDLDELKKCYELAKVPNQSGGVFKTNLNIIVSAGKKCLKAACTGSFYRSTFSL